MKGMLKLAGIVVLACMALVLMPGCTDAQFAESQARATEIQGQLHTYHTALEALLGEQNVLEDAIADAEANPPTDPEALVEWQEKIDALKEKLRSFQPKITQAQELIKSASDSLDKIVQQIKDAKTGEEALGNAIATGGSAIGTALMQPMISIVLGLVGGLFTWFGSRKRLKAAGAAAVATGIEAGRNDELEAKHPGFIVVEKATADIVHKASGVSDAIAGATK